MNSGASPPLLDCWARPPEIIRTPMAVVTRIGLIMFASCRSQPPIACRYPLSAIARERVDNAEQNERVPDPALRSGGGLPLRHGCIRRFGEVNLAVDVIDPIDGNDVTESAGCGIVLGQQDCLG